MTEYSIKSKSNVILVDLDNIYIIRNRVNIKTLKKRVAIIKSLGNKTYWFGNAYTADIIAKYNIDIDVITTRIEANSADHHLIHFLGGLRTNKVTIITSDTTLQKIAKFVYPYRKISFVHFSPLHSLEHSEVNFSFKTREHLKKFVTSLLLFKQRFS